jgi:hypothetical protein
MRVAIQKGKALTTKLMKWKEMGVAFNDEEIDGKMKEWGRGE